METNNTNQQVKDLIFNQKNDITNDMHTSNVQKGHQTNKKVKKTRGNRKLQRYRRKLRQQGMKSDAIVSFSSSTTTTTTSMASVDSESKTSTEIKDQNRTTTTSCIINEAITRRSATIKSNKINRQRNKNINMKISLNEPISIHEVNSLVSAELLKNIDNSMDYASVPDEVFCQMLSTAFSGTNKLDDYFLQEKEKIDFVRHCTSLMSRLSYVKLLEQQWDYYYHIGITQNIWTGRISKHLAEKNSVCYTYGRSKKMIQQRRTQIQQQLQQIHNTIALFEKEILLKVDQHTDCSSEIKILLSIINIFVHEHQQKSRDEFEYKRQILILDATDHHLLQTFFNLKPTKSQITCARHIWQATAKQILLEEQITVMEHRRTAVSSSSLSTINLSDRVFDDIDEKLTKSVDNIDQNPSDSSLSIEFEKMKQFKQDMINQSVQTGRTMIETIAKTIHDERNKFFFKRNADEHRSNMEVAIVNAIETRRSHMIERGKYITKQKLITSFKRINYTKDNIN